MPHSFDSRTNDFPLYTEAVKFFNHPDDMVRTAVRSLTLNVYEINDPDLRSFILNSHAVPYFSNLIWLIRDEILMLDEIVATSDILSHGKLMQNVDQIVDSFYYLMDILKLGIPNLSAVLEDQMLAHLVLPVLVGSFGNKPLCSRTSALFLLTQLFMVFPHSSLINSIVCSLLKPNPPKLVLYLVEYPPEFALQSATHVSDVLCSSTEVYTPRTACSRLLSDELFGDIDDVPSPVEDICPKVQSDDKEILKHDLNLLTVRSKVPELAEVSGFDNYIGYSEAISENPYRKSIFECLSSSDDNSVFGVLAMLFSILRNSSVKLELLIQCGVCPRRVVRNHDLLQGLVRSKPEENVASGEEVRYDNVVIDLLFDLLCQCDRPEHRFVTLELAAELLLAFTKGPSPCLKPKHLTMLDQVYSVAKGELLRLIETESADPSLVMCLMDEESGVNNIDSNRVDSILVNALALLPATADTHSEMNLKFQTPMGEVQVLRRAVQVFLLARRIWCQLNDTEDSSFPILLERSYKYTAGQSTSWCRYLFVFEFTNLMIASAEGSFDCTLAGNNSAVSLVLRGDYVLLVEPEVAGDKTSLPVIRMVTTCARQEAAISGRDPMILNLTLLARRIPHLLCERLLGSERNTLALWKLGLKFSDAESADQVFQLLTSKREKMRQELGDGMLTMLNAEGCQFSQ